MSWNFPAKIRNSVRPIPSFEMMSKFPGWDHSCRRRYVNKLFGGKKDCEAVCEAVRKKTTGTK